MNRITLSDINQSKGATRIHLLRCLEMEYVEVLTELYNDKDKKARKKEIKDILKRYKRLTYQ